MVPQRPTSRPMLRHSVGTSAQPTRHTGDDTEPLLGERYANGRETNVLQRLGTPPARPTLRVVDPAPQATGGRRHTSEALGLNRPNRLRRPRLVVSDKRDDGGRPQIHIRLPAVVFVL